MGIGVFAMALSLPFTAPGGAGTATDVLALAIFLVFCALTAYAAVALALEEVVVDETGVRRHNPIWRDRVVGWDQIESVSLATDFNTHPAITVRQGKVIRLRGAASLWASDRSTARKAVAAIERRLAGAD